MIVNLTPHTLNLPSGDVESSGVARVQSETVQTGEHEGVPLVTQKFGDVEGLPEPQDGVIYVVSRLVMEAVKNYRDDVYCPGDLIRDANGKVIGCKNLSR